MKLKEISMAEARKIGDGGYDATNNKGVNAREYFKKIKNDYGFASNKFDKGEAWEFVKSLYKAGARKILITGLYTETRRQAREGDIYADTMEVKMPKNLLEYRKVVKSILRGRPDDSDESGGWYMLWWD